MWIRTTFTVFFSKKRLKKRAFAWHSVKIRIIFSLKDEKLIQESKPTWKLKHANSILEYSEYFCPMSSKSIVIILSHTVSKLVRFEIQCIDVKNTGVFLSPVLFRRQSRSYRDRVMAKACIHLRTTSDLKSLDRTMVSLCTPATQKRVVVDCVTLCTLGGGGGG